MPASEHHFVHRVGWLRAAVLGANDGIVSTGSLIVGVAAASTESHSIMVAGVAGLVAGALSMAAGEYVSVSSQADTELADLETERRALDESPKDELRELAAIYVGRGVEPELAHQVATQLTEYDALGAHARDELGMSQEQTARPVQAALTSAATFACGASLPLLAAKLAPFEQVVPVVAGASLLSLAMLGVISARAGGAGTLTATLRITLWGAAAMGLTALVGSVFGAVI